MLRLVMDQLAQCECALTALDGCHPRRCLWLRLVLATFSTGERTDRGFLSIKTHRWYGNNDYFVFCFLCLHSRFKLGCA